MAGRVWIKQGVMGSLQPVAQKGFGRVAKLYHDNGEDFFVTSIQEGTHSAGSLHYSGMAFDFQKGGVRLDTIKRTLGGDWDVLPSEAGAIHAEYDPK